MSQYLDGGTPLRVRLGDVVRTRPGNSKLIKGKLPATSTEGLFAAYSASGQDVFAPHYEYDGNAVVISAVGARCGKCFLAAGKWTGIANTHALLPDETRITAKFLWYQVNDERFWVRGGSAQPFVRVKDSLEKLIYAPDLAAQHNIVAEIEMQFSRLDEAVANLKRVKANLGRYRSAVLREAFSDQSQAWRWGTFSDAGEVTTGFTPATSEPANFGGDVPFFKPTDLDAGDNVRLAREYLTAQGLRQGRRLAAGSVLVTCIGATIGKTGLAQVECATNQQINAVSPRDGLMDARFLYWWTVSPLGRRQILDNASATTLPIINKSKFSALSVPFPPLAEQHRIVAEVDRRLSIVRAVEVELVANLKRAQSLRQSVLQAAFACKLPA